MIHLVFRITLLTPRHTYSLHTIFIDIRDALDVAIAGFAFRSIKTREQS